MFYYCQNSDTTTGRHFDDSLFDVILTFTSKDLQEEDPSFNTVMNASEKFVREDPVKTRALGYLCKDPNILTSEIFEELCAVVRYDDNFIAAGFVDEDDKLSLDKIKEGWEDAKQMIYKQLKLEDVTLAAFYIARGMRSATESDEKWDNFIKKDFLAVSGKIQGSLDRELIASSIDSTCPSLTPLIRQKGEWLRNWIRDPTTTVQDLRNFLLFATGSSSLPLGKKLELQKQYSNVLPVPKAHTCSYVLELAPDACGALGPAFNDGTEEGFRRALRIALVNPIGYQLV